MKLINKIIISLLISISTIILLSLKSFAVTGVITEVTVNVREKASTNSKRIMYVTQDDKVDVLEKDGDWYKIKYNDKTGYVSSKYLNVDDSKLTETKNIENIDNTDKNEEAKEEKDTTKNIEAKLYIKSETGIRIIPNILSNVVYVSTEDNISVNVIEQLNQWSYISVNNIFGWVRTDKIFEENAEESTTENNESETTNEDNTTENNEKKEIAYVKYDTVNLREKASATSKILSKLKLNNEVTVLENVDSVWTKIEIDGKTGYVSTELLSNEKQDETETKNENTTSRDGDTTDREEEKNESPKVEQTANTNPSSITKGEEIVAYAKQYLGYKYVYGGTSPSTGFDCSGLTYYVYKHFGYTLSRSSGGQANNGTKVDKKDLQLGDILIFKNNALTKIGHVGIYIGNNKMLHASEPGVGVTITDIDSKAYKYPQRYVMARRII